LPIEKSDDISKKSTVEMWLLENKRNTYFSPILKFLLAKSQNLARKKTGCWNSREQTGTGGLFLPNLELSWFQMVLKDEAGIREARKLLGIFGTEFRLGKHLGSGIASGSEVMN
jgi:hypothetical protein